MVTGAEKNNRQRASRHNRLLTNSLASCRIASRKIRLPMRRGLSAKRHTARSIAGSPPGRTNVPRDRRAQIVRFNANSGRHYVKLNRSASDPKRKSADIHPHYRMYQQSNRRCQGFLTIGTELQFRDAQMFSAQGRRSGRHTLSGRFEVT